MSDTTIIWEMIDAIIKDDHPTVYQYVSGRQLSKESAIMRIGNTIVPIFEGAYDKNKVKMVIIEFLKQKERDYKQGLIKIKSIY